MSIQRILIANRGEIARRIMRACRSMGISTAAIYSDPDRDAPFVREADVAAYIGPPMTGSSFLAIDKILSLARKLEADAIHPGYGFLAENAAFARACAEAGVIFIGPSPQAIERMGSKIEAKRIAEAAGVPIIPGFSALGLGNAEIATQAKALGFPLLVKASAGGGGKGMRVVREIGGLEEALEAARREAKSSFGDDALLLERYIESPRHIEIQILGDQQGNLVHCFERECSVQRRYQKIVEEAPSPAVDPDLRQRMGSAALSLARAIGYSSAGTVEFVVDPRGGFYFLEVNTRLQVEHPVTEEIAGIDLVRLQIEIAEGKSLPFRQEDLRIRGHAIECRVCAEDPNNDFLPSIGRVERWETPALDGVRYESGVRSGSEVTIHYDPMLAKVIAHGTDRDEAARRLATALSRLRAQGIRTNVGYLVQILRHPEFLAGRLDTHFLERHGDALRSGSAPSAEVESVHAVGAALWLQEDNRDKAPVLRHLPSGWRNNPSQMQEVGFAGELQEWRVRYRLRTADVVDVEIGDTAQPVRILGLEGETLRLEISGLSRTFRLARRDDTVFVYSSLGSSELRLLPRFPSVDEEEVHGGCTAPMPGKILAIRVEPASQVKKGETLVVLEAMKMEHPVTAPRDAVVAEIRVEVGQQVEAGTVLVVLDAG